MKNTSFKTFYFDKVVPALKEKFKYKNSLEVPRLVMVVVNVGATQALKDAKYLDTIIATLSRITGQKPVPCLARKSIAAFKTRAGQVIGEKVTLRGQRMYDFLEKVIKISIPRIRDFRGLSTDCLDGRGNLSIGFSEHIVFPEIKPDEIERIHGLEVTVVTNAKTKEEALELFRLLGFPFRNK